MLHGSRFTDFRRPSPTSVLNLVLQWSLGLALALCRLRPRSLFLCQKHYIATLLGKIDVLISPVPLVAHEGVPSFGGRGYMRVDESGGVPPEAVASVGVSGEAFASLERQHCSLREDVNSLASQAPGLRIRELS